MNSKAHETWIKNKKEEKHTCSTMSQLQHSASQQGYLAPCRDLHHYYGLLLIQVDSLGTFWSASHTCDQLKLRKVWDNKSTPTATLPCLWPCTLAACRQLGEKIKLNRQPLTMLFVADCTRRHELRKNSSGKKTDFWKRYVTRKMR